MSKGFLVFAQNNNKVDYVKLAYALALSIKHTQKSWNNISVAVTPGTRVPEKYKKVFDKIIEIPWEDDASTSEWKLENEWKAYHITPYEETIKLEADMILPEDITHWWKILSTREIVVTSNIINIQNQPTKSLVYRPGFKENGVEPLYSAFMYFKKSTLGLDFFKMAEIITWNWETFYWKYMPEKSPKIYSTDTTYSLAAKLLDEVENIKSPWVEWPAFVHAKTGLTDWNKNIQNENWDEITPFSITPKLECFIGPYRMFYPVHYHLKHVMKDEYISFYEEALGIE